MPSFRAASALLVAGLLTAPACRAGDGYASGFFLDLRYRDSTLHQATLADAGHAHTLRLQWGYLWAWTPHWAAYAEATRVWSLFGREYNDTSGRRTPYPAEADPPSSELSEAWLGYRDQRVELRFGRQYLNLDDRRFFSANPWRQNPQSFDGASASLNLHGAVLSLGWIGQVNRTLGADFPDPEQRRWKLDGRWLHLQQALPLGTLVGYGYFMKNLTLPADSVRSLGLRWNGERALGDAWRLAWTAEGAHQNGYANNPARYGLGYRLFEFKLGVPALAARLGEESLGGNGREAFNIAYGAGHSFDGWVGVFNIPLHGLLDRYGGLLGQLPWQGWSWQLVHHDFRPVDGARAHYGEETDAGLLAALGRGFSLELEYGDYRAGSFSVDQRKLWLMAEYRYGGQSL